MGLCQAQNLWPSTFILSTHLSLYILNEDLGKLNHQYFAGRTMNWASVFWFLAVILVLLWHMELFTRCEFPTDLPSSNSVFFKGHHDDIHCVEFDIVSKCWLFYTPESLITGCVNDVVSQNTRH